MVGEIDCGPHIFGALNLVGEVFFLFIRQYHRRGTSIRAFHAEPIIIFMRLSCEK